MFAMLLKDILSLKKNIITYAAFLVIYTIIGIYAGDAGFFLSISLVFCVMMPITALSVDEHCHWERIQACMPITRGAAVISKYVLALLTLFFTLIPAFAAVAVHVLQIGDVAIPALSGQDVILMAILGVFMTALQMPFLILLGVEKGRFISMGVVLLVCFGIPILVLRSNFISRGTERFLEHIYNEMANHIQPGMWLLGFVTIILLAISIFISVRGYQKKEIT